MRYFFVILLFSLQARAQTMLFTTRVPWVSSATVKDDGYYNAFPMIADARDMVTYGVYKKSASHPAAGPLMLIKSYDGGLSWTEDTIKVGGVAISSSNHSFQWMASGRIVISYRDTAIQFAYSDDNGATFTHSGTIPNETNYSIVQSPTKMLVMPSGHLLFTYRKVGSNGNPATGEIMESADGITFTHKSQIYSHDSLASSGNATLGNWRGNEIAISLTTNTGVDSTCKLIAIVRTEVSDGGTYPMVFMSADGGKTWTIDLTKDAGTLTDDNGVVTTGNFSRHLLWAFLTSDSPVDIALHKGTVYVAMGERNATYGYALKYTKANPDSAYRNKFTDWARPTFVKFYNLGGSTTDCGYPVFFEAYGHLYVAEYQVSTQTYNPALSTRRVLSEIIKIAD